MMNALTAKYASEFETNDQKGSVSHATEINQIMTKKMKKISG